MVTRMANVQKIGQALSALGAVLGRARSFTPAGQLQSAVQSLRTKPKNQTVADRRILKVPVRSSWIRQLQFNPATNKIGMVVGTKMYVYKGNIDIFTAWTNSASKGRWWWRTLRNRPSRKYGLGTGMYRRQMATSSRSLW